MNLPTLKAMLAQQRLKALALIAEGQMLLRDTDAQLKGIGAAEELAAAQAEAVAKPEPDPE